MVTEGVEWEVQQVVDSVTPGNPSYSEKSRLAKTILSGRRRPGATPAPTARPWPTPTSKMTCYACHSAWTTSCFGCHLSQKANEKKPKLHNEGGESRNWTSYNFQTLRDDIYFLARDGDRHQEPHRARALRLRRAGRRRQNQNREWIYSQQQTVSAGRLLGHRLLDLRAPHRAHQGDHGLHRLPRVEGRRQQRLDGRSC